MIKWWSNHNNHYLNEGTIKNSYPLLLIPTLIDQICEADMFTCLDLRWGYNNIWIKEGDKWKATFVTPLGAYEPVVMYFDMTNSPSIFQQMMNDIFNDLYAVLIIYLDDLMTFTERKSQQEHEAIVKEVL